MDFTTILSISGKPGLYKVISQSKNGLIVESLSEKKRMPVYASHKVSSLSDISIYTYEEDKPLKDILKNLFKHTDGKEGISPNASAAELTSFFREVEPEFDEERVYSSDIKKLLKWYNILLAAGFFENIDEEEDNDEKTEEVEASEPEAKKEKKAAKKTEDKAKKSGKDAAEKSNSKKKDNEKQ